MSLVLQLRSERAKLNEQVQALAKIESDGGELSVEQLAQFVQLETQIKDVTAKITRAESAERIAAETAVPVEESAQGNKGSPTHVTTHSEPTKPGVAMAQMVRLMVQAGGNQQVAAEMAKTGGYGADVHMALSTVTPVSYTHLGLAQAVRQYTGKSFANGVTVSGVIERPREAPAIKDQGSIDKIVDQWGQKFSGIDNAKKVAMLQEGMTFKPVSMNNVDAEVLGILKTTGTDIARIYKIPLPMVNDLEKSNYNTLEQLMIQFVVFALLPWVKRHEQSMMRDFLLPTDRRNYFIEFNLSGLLRGDQKSRYEAYAIGRQWGWLSANDIRRLENMPPVPGGDIYMQPLNMVDAGKSGGDLTNPAVRAQLEMQHAEIERILAQ